MGEHIHLFEEYVDTDYSKRVLIQGQIDIDDEKPKFSVGYSISDRAAGHDILQLRLPFVADNGIWLASLDPSYALGAYGLCVANKLTHATYDQVKACYDQVSQSNPSASTMDLIRLTASCVGQNNSKLVQEVKRALKQCLTFGLFSGGN